MTLVKTFEDLVKWLNEQVCVKIELKMPNDDDNSGTLPRYIHPAAFPLYVPGKDRLPPSVLAPIPSVCVQLLEGSDELLAGKRRLKLRLCLACWNPGENGGDTFYARENAQALGGYSYYRLDGPEALERYARNTEGWRDVWNFADLVLKEIESTEYIAGWRLAKEAGITYGPFTEDGVIWDYYPYWHSWIAFTLEAGAVQRTPEKYKDLL